MSDVREVCKIDMYGGWWTTKEKKTKNCEHNWIGDLVEAVCEEDEHDKKEEEEDDTKDGYGWRLPVTYPQLW